MKWVVRESSSGKLYQVSTKTANTEEVYKVFAKVVLGLDTSGDFDTGNVDIDIQKIVTQKVGEAVEIFKDK